MTNINAGIFRIVAAIYDRRPALTQRCYSFNFVMMTSTQIRQSFLDFFKSKLRSIVSGNITVLSALLGLVVLICGCGPRTTNEFSIVAGLKLLDLDGKSVDPFQVGGAKAAVFIFIRTDCPISNGYALEIQRLRERFASKGASFWLVYVGSEISVEDIRRHLLEYQLTGVALRDPKLELVRACQVRVTPEAAVFESAGRLVYHGRIDDRFEALGLARPAPTRRDLEEVLTAVTEGKPVVPTSTKAVGCAIRGAR